MPVLVEQYVVVGDKRDAEKGRRILALRAESLQVLLQHSRSEGNSATCGQRGAIGEGLRRLARQHRSCDPHSER